ncbi:MAG: acyl-CoA carboxylase subunit epsilon [Pseudonocardiaceae bacterium]
MRGDPSEEEVAALTAVVASLASGGLANARAPEPTTACSAWGDPTRQLRAPLPGTAGQWGPGGWRASAFPR